MRKFERIDEWEDYVPNVGDERRLARVRPADALTVQIRFITPRRHREYKRIWLRAADDEKLDRAADADRLMFIENVRDVRNYSPNGAPIATAEELWDQGEQEVLDDIATAIRGRSYLEAGLAKKLRSQPDSSSLHQSQSSGGGAADASADGHRSTIQIPLMPS